MAVGQVSFHNDKQVRSPQFQRVRADLTYLI